MDQQLARGGDPRISDLADEIGALVGSHPRSIAIEALSQVVSLMCVTRTREESRTALAEFLSSAERKRSFLEETFACRGSR